MKKNFRYKLLGTGPNKSFPYIELPFDSVAFFGTKARVPVKVTINGVEMQMSVAPMGGRHVIGFRRELAEKAGIAVGDEVRVTIEKDEDQRTIAVPADLAKAFRKNAAARRAWDALAYSHQREHANAIADAKKPETRARRIERTLEMLTSTGKPARPAPSAKPLSKRLHIKPGMKVVIVGAPTGFALDVPTAPLTTKSPDVAMFFARHKKALNAFLSKIEKLADSTALWIAYPKTTSGVKTDITRDQGWDALEEAGLSAVTQVAVDQTWSALRFRRG
jgi:hypothetical protein